MAASLLSTGSGNDPTRSIFFSAHATMLPRLVKPPDTTICAGPPPTQILFHLFDRRHQTLRITTALAQMRSHYDLVLRVRRICARYNWARLRVVAMLHPPCFRFGQKLTRTSCFSFSTPSVAPPARLPSPATAFRRSDSPFSALPAVLAARYRPAVSPLGPRIAHLFHRLTGTLQMFFQALLPTEGIGSGLRSDLCPRRALPAPGSTHLAIPRYP